MKTSQLIIILALIAYCLADEELDVCEKEYEDKLFKKNEIQCTNINSSCSFNSLDETCIETHPCQNGNNDRLECPKIIPTVEFDKKKCVYDPGSQTCNLADRECNDWKRLGSNVAFNKDDCTKLKAPNGQGDRCQVYLEFWVEHCGPFFDSCRNLPQTKCNNNIPKPITKKCHWEPTPAEGDPYCNEIPRYCEDSEGYNFQLDKDICWELEINELPTDRDYHKKKCIYKDSTCKTEYELCESIYVPSGSPSSFCDLKVPLNSTTKYYDYKKKCTFDTSTKCKTVTRKCKEFNSPIAVPTELLNEDFCKELEVTDKETYRCAYDEKDKKCYEEYLECEYYITNKVETDREGCQNIRFTEKTKKCVYDIKEDKCVTKQIFSKCEDYQGKDKKTCESILSPDSNLPFCILDKDSKCIEKPLLCSETFDKKDCLNIAKAKDENKRCAWDKDGCFSSWCEPKRSSNTCYEEYIRCEDYLGKVDDACENIRLYDGKKCIWDKESLRCRSINKICDDATTEEECKLISETGVSDTEKKICAWSFNKCRETYKYCSDYRESCSKGSINSFISDIQVYSRCQDICENIIKPYNESGNYLDIGFKCYYEYGVGCQKVKVECKDAGTNPILCNLYSNYIYDDNKKYCGFFEGQCKEYYKKCEDVEFTPGDANSELKCTNNIIQESKIYQLCQIKNRKCVKKDGCNLYTSIGTLSLTSTNQPDSFFKDICESINPNCTFDPNTYLCNYKEKTCDKITFYSDDPENKETCERKEASKPYKKCVLKEDKSGCEEVYREISYSTSSTSYSQPPNADTQESSSNINAKGINIIILLILLLF